jgi:hypothetical protein
VANATDIDFFVATRKKKSCHDTPLRFISERMGNKLLSDIDEYLAATGWSDYTFGLRAAHNGRLVGRLRSGGRVWPETEAMIRDFIRNSECTRRTSKAA